MRFVIVTGVSGAGKTSALKMLEDAKYFCVDNLPIPLLEKFASLMPEIHGEDVQNVALGIDARSGRSLDELEIVLDRMKKAGYDFEILFLDAQDSVLVKRYKETRRSHPLAMGGRVDDGIRMEREKMDCDIARTFADKLEDMINFLIPNYVKEGKTNLVIAIGCTGGKHRSVTLARELYSRLSGNTKYGFRLEHRDAQKDRLVRKQEG